VILTEGAKEEKELEENFRLMLNKVNG